MMAGLLGPNNRWLNGQRVEVPERADDLTTPSRRTSAAVIAFGAQALPKISNFFAVGRYKGAKLQDNSAPAACEGFEMSSKPSYSIDSDPRKNFMRLTFSGHMDHATVDCFERDLAAAFVRMPAKGDCRFLSDIRHAGVQSRDITERLQAIMARYIVHHGSLTRGIAMIVSGSSLEMMQAKRVAGSGGTAFFLTEDEATAWLFDETASVLASS